MTVGAVKGNIAVDLDTEARSVERRDLEPAAIGQQGEQRETPHKVTPRFQMAISRSSLRSAAVSRPEATAQTVSSRASAAGAMPSSSTRRASKSIQPGLRAARSLFEAILMVGTGKPSGVPRPVVNRIAVAPAAASAGEETDRK